MADSLVLLQQLQALDTQLYRLRRERDAAPEQLAALQADLDRAAAILQTAETQLKTLQLQHKEKELELQTQEGRVKKLQLQLLQVKTNKEYTAMQQEIAGAKTDNSMLEETIIRLLDELDSAQAKVTQAQEQLAQETRRVEEQRRQIEQDVAQMTRHIATLDAQRARLAPQVQGPLLQQYERILVNRDGLAMVPVSGDACSGCQMVLRPQLLNELQLGKALVTCENCSRILYLSDPARAEAS